MITRLSITSFFQPRALLLGVVTAVVLISLLPHITHAQAQSGVISSIGTGIERILWVVVNVLFGWLVWVGGMLLNTAINDFVIGFGNLYTGASGLGFTIDRLWVVVRDIFNLTFIFGLVFIGLRMIFDSSNSSTRKMLIYLILAALLVNFSLFITKFVIDFSNIAAAQLATAFQVNGGPANVSGSFMNLMGLTGLINTGAGAGFNFANMTGGAGIGYILGTMILYIITAFVFLGGALLLMIRFVVLNIYMVLSPLMFIGWVFPSLSNITREYWHGFLGRAFFAPAYLLMLYFAQSVLTTFAITAPGQTASLSTIFTEAGQANFSTVVPPFVLTAVFLIAALVVAQRMGANGADGVISFGKTMTGKAKQYTKQAAYSSTYLPRAGARASVNWAGGKVLKKFDGWQAGAKDAASKSGAGLGTRLTGWTLSRNVTDRAVRGGLTSMKDAQLGTGTTNEKEGEYARKVQANINQTTAERARDKAFTDALETLEKEQDSTEKLTTALEELGKTIKSMSKSEKEGLELKKLQDKHIAVHLTDSDIEGIEKTGKYSAAEIQGIKDARKTGLISIAAGGNTFAKVDGGTVTGYTNKAAAGIDRRSSLLGQSVTDIGKLPADVFKQSAMSGLITPQMLQERLRNGISTKEQDEIRSSLEAFLATADEGKRNAWRKWTDSTTYGSSFGLTIPVAAAPQPQNQSAPLTWPTIDGTDQGN